MALLEVKNVSRRFGGIVALDEVSFEVGEGEIVGLIGPNGAGKTTLVNVICGQSAPGTGRVMLGGTVLSELPAHRVAHAGLARTFQNIRLFERMTVRENVLVAVSYTHLTLPTN